MTNISTRPVRMYNPYVRMSNTQLSSIRAWHECCIRRITLFGENVEGESEYHLDRLARIEVEQKRRFIP